MSCAEYKRLFLKVHGTVQQVDPATGRVELIVHGLKMSFTLSPDCPELPSGRPLDLRQVRPGEHLEVSYAASARGLTVHGVRLARVSWAAARAPRRPPAAATPC